MPVEPKAEGQAPLKLIEAKEYVTDRFGRVVEKASALVKRAVIVDTQANVIVGGDGLRLPDNALSFAVPQNATQRYIWWTATEVTDPTNVAMIWAIFGRIVFSVNGAKSCEIEFGAQNGYLGGDGPSVYISPPATMDVGGGQQPAALINFNWAGAYYTFRSLCLATRATADKIEFVVDKSSVSAGGFLSIGAYVMSEHETE